VSNSFDEKKSSSQQSDEVFIAPDVTVLKCSHVFHSQVTLTSLMCNDFQLGSVVHQRMAFEQGRVSMLQMHPSII
jgi:hypothetical protein